MNSQNFSLQSNRQRLSGNQGKGFTLVELLIAITILAVILSISMSYNSQEGQREILFSNKIESQLSSLESALETYNEARDEYPSKDDTNCSNEYPVNYSESCLPDLIPSFLVAVPKPQPTLNFINEEYYQYYKDDDIVYLCFSVKDNLSKTEWNALKRFKEKQDEGKVYFSDTECGAIADYVTPLPDNPPGMTIYITYWIRRS